MRQVVNQPGIAHLVPIAQVLTVQVHVAVAHQGLLALRVRGWLRYGDHTPRWRTMRRAVGIGERAAVLVVQSPLEHQASVKIPLVCIAMVNVLPSVAVTSVAFRLELTTIGSATGVTTSLS